MLSIGVPLLLHLCHHVKQCCIISLLNPSIDNHCLQYFNLAGDTSSLVNIFGPISQCLYVGYHFLLSNWTTHFRLHIEFLHQSPLGAISTIELSTLHLGFILSPLQFAQNQSVVVGWSVPIHGNIFNTSVPGHANRYMWILWPQNFEAHHLPAS